MANKYKVQLVTDDTPITGSINKILSLGDTSDGTEHPNVFDDVQFGVFVSNIETDTVSTVTDNFTVPTGTYLHGPITGFSLNAAGSVLVYYND